LVIGWHFFQEGAVKVKEGFSSTPFLSAAKGPFAKQFQSMIPDHDGAIRIDAKTMSDACEAYGEQIKREFALTEDQCKEVDAILADIGVSSHQFDIADRGFSFRSAAPLDMRMNQKASVTAAELLNKGSEEDLLRIFNSYTDLPNVFRLVQTILTARQQFPFETTDQLAKLCEPLAQRGKDHKYIAQVFQALRIEVNDEIGALKKLLEDSVNLLNTGGRIAVISYHSIEDRLVKNFFKKGNFEGKEVRDFYGNLLRPFDEINRHPIVPTEAEVLTNNRARSAKLRIAQKQ
jgi:16S rRNA (cytosine1402-N4)-methyltransferase